MAIDRTDITLPVWDWLNNNDIWKLFEDARDCKSDKVLFQLHEKYGRHLHDILKIVASCSLKSLDFLGLDLLESNRGTTLQGAELISAIQSLTIVIEKLLNTTDTLSCVDAGQIVDQESLQKAFENSPTYHNLDLADYHEEGLFIMLKSLLLVMNDALANNKVFVYIMFAS